MPTKTSRRTSLAASSRRTGRVALRQWGRLTSGRRVTPNTLIVGAQRAGTTAMFRAITSNRAATGPVHWKGVHYFDMEYQRGLPWYQAHFPTRRTVAQIAGRTGVASPVVLEASPYYMFHPAVSGRIAHDLPGVRVIVLLRDPVQRAYSAWEHESARGFEELTFPEALRAEDSRLAGTTQKLLSDPAFHSTHHRHHGYVARGMYHEQLVRLAGDLGRENMLVLDSHRYFSAPDDTLQRVFEFLGLPAQRHPEVFTNARTGRERMDPGTEAYLRGRFADPDQRLADWLGWAPSWLT